MRSVLMLLHTRNRLRRARKYYKGTAILSVEGVNAANISSIKEYVSAKFYLYVVTKVTILKPIGMFLIDNINPKRCTKKSSGHAAQQTSIDYYLLWYMQK